MQEALREGLENEGPPQYFRPKITYRNIERTITLHLEDDLPFLEPEPMFMNTRQIIKYALRSPQLLYLYIRHTIRYKRIHGHINPYFMQ